MFPRITATIAFAFVLLILSARPSIAIDDNSSALGFLPDDAAVVMAVNMDEVFEYGRDVGDDWREADRARFFDALGSLSGMVTMHVGKPDIFSFFGNLSGVQAFTLDSCGEVPLMVFTAGSRSDLDILSAYTYEYILDTQLAASVNDIEIALQSYYYRTVLNEETGEETTQYSYPESLDDLIEFGFLEEIPINPYTGKQIVILDSEENPGYGDITYTASSDSYNYYTPAPDAETDGPPVYSNYEIKVFRPDGVMIRKAWENKFVPADDIEEKLSGFKDKYNPADLGFAVEASRGWTYVKVPDGDYGFAYGDKHLLFGSSVETLKEAVGRKVAGNGFEFKTHPELDTEGAFYREQVDLKFLVNHMLEMSTMGLSELGLGYLPTEYMELAKGLIKDTGINNLGNVYTACWLTNGDIKATCVAEVPDELDGTLVGKLMSFQPEELMTAEYGPFDLIGEVAWANPNEFSHAYIDYIFDSILPVITKEMGVEGMDPTMMLDMVGLGNIEEMDLGDQMYVLLTSSEDRGDGLYLPGMVSCLKTENTDLPYIAVGAMDSLSFMIPDFPLVQAESQNDDSATWVLGYEELPLTPTIAWTDGWVVKGLWREDVLAARDAIKKNQMFEPDFMNPANYRSHIHRRELFRALADIAYVIPEDGVPAIGGLFELVAQYSGPDERLYCEETVGDGYIVSRFMFSINSFENLVPALTYVVKAAESSGGF